MRTRLLITAAVWSIHGIASAQQPADIFAFDDSLSAQRRWSSQFGIHPIHADRDKDGNAHLLLTADFAKQKDRACWDWQGQLDLSHVGRISFELAADGGGLIETIGIYFGTPNGWYARFLSGATGSDWKHRTLALDTFGTEGTPDGWDQVTTFRFSVWSSAAGTAVLRLRDFRGHALDPAENLLKNGSFEVPGVGVPYGWGSGHWGVGRLPWVADMDVWRRHWRLDGATARHGTSSLCIQNTPDLPLLKAVSVWVDAPKQAKTLALSAWLKADRPDLPVTLGCAGRSVEARAGADWSQAILAQVPAGHRMLVTIAPKAPGTLWIDAVQLQTGAEPTPEFHPAFVDAEIATREALVDWSPPRRTAAVAAGRHVAGPVQTAAVRIDAHGRFLVNGKPYLQHSFGLEYVSDPAVLDVVAQAGFRDVCIQIREALSTEQLRTIFDRAAATGLRVIPWLDGRMSRERFAEHVTTLKSHPALLCWYVFDEPSGDRFAEADARVALARKLDPHHPAFINYLSNKLEGHTGDIYSTDVYPIPHSHPLSAIQAVERMLRSAKAQSKPVWMWLQGTGYAYWMDREPSPRELSCMVYGSLIAGARGIYYFAQFPRTGECLAEMRALCVELDALVPALWSLDSAPVAECDPSGIMCKAFANAGKLTVLAVNTRNSTTAAALTLPGATGHAAVLFEERRVKVTEGSWHDTFGPFGRHVYTLQRAMEQPGD